MVEMGNQFSLKIEKENSSLLLKKKPAMQAAR